LFQTNENHLPHLKTLKSVVEDFPAQRCQCRLRQISLIWGSLPCGKIMFLDSFLGLLFWIAWCTLLWSKCINSCTIWKKINMNHSCIPAHTCCCVLNFYGFRKCIYQLQKLVDDGVSSHTVHN
jgi:hypothetical protein